MICDTARLIKDAVDIRDVCELYGVHFSGRNQAVCPFHDDKHPSSSVKNCRFHCFVCDLHLDIFDFVMQMTGCDFQGAKEQLNSAFHIGLDLHAPIKSDDMRRLEAERKRKQKELESYRAEYDQMDSEFIILWRLTRAYRPEPDKPGMGEYAWALGRIDQLNQYFMDHRWR